MTEARYAVPVYSVDESGHSTNELSADDDVDEFVIIRHHEYQIGDPELVAEYRRGETKGRYRFRVTDADLRWCSYQGDPSELPVPVQHAVTAFGFGIIDLHDTVDGLCEMLELARIGSVYHEIEERYGQLPLLVRLIHDLETPLYVLTRLLLAKVTLPEEEYWAVWDRLDLDRYEHFGPLSDDLITEFESVLPEMEALEQLAMGTSPEDGTVLSQTEHLHLDGDKYVLVDLISNCGSLRFQFRNNGGDSYVKEKPDDVVVPPDVVAEFHTSSTVDNIHSLFDSEGLTSVAEHALRFLSSLDAEELIDDSINLTRLGPIERAFYNAKFVGPHLIFLDHAEELYRRLHRDACNEYDISDPDTPPAEVIDHAALDIIEIATEYVDYDIELDEIDKPRQIRDDI